jgi:broad specificity phosphatase PhoE
MPSAPFPEASKVESASRRCGSIAIARHGEPALSRRIKLSAEGYRRWWAAYEEGGILDAHAPPAELLQIVREADVIFASSRRRAVETAEAVVQGRHFIRDSLFYEAPLPPPRAPGWFKLNPRHWGVIARAVWWFGHTEGQESRPEAQARAALVAERLAHEANQGKNVVLLAHGFFNHMVGARLRKSGWSLKSGKGHKYWSTRRYERD